MQLYEITVFQDRALPLSQFLMYVTILVVTMNVQRICVPVNHRVHGRSNISKFKFCLCLFLLLY